MTSLGLHSWYVMERSLEPGCAESSCFSQLPTWLCSLVSWQRIWGPADLGSRGGFGGWPCTLHLESCFLPLDKSRPWGASWGVRNSEAGEGCRTQPAKGKPGLQGEDTTGWGVGTVRGGRRVLSTDVRHLKLHPLPSFPPLLSSLKACTRWTQAVEENQVKESPHFPDFPREPRVPVSLIISSD